MSTAPSFKGRPAPTKTAIVVDADARVEAVLRFVLKLEVWSIRHVPDNLAVLARVEAEPCDLRFKLRCQSPTALFGFDSPVQKK